jgi:hypothetical protein
MTWAYFVFGVLSGMVLGAWLAAATILHVTGQITKKLFDEWELRQVYKEHYANLKGTKHEPEDLYG